MENPDFSFPSYNNYAGNSIKRFRCTLNSSLDSVQSGLYYAAFHRAMSKANTALVQVAGFL